jgi:hypothetical protein
MDPRQNIKLQPHKGHFHRITEKHTSTTGKKDFFEAKFLNFDSKSSHSKKKKKG